MTTEEKYLNLRQERGTEATLQQRQAANPAASVWVEASAGTGKTKVLSDRVLRLLLSGVNPTRLLCLTYTKAAAVEMSTRISERLSQWAVIADEKLHKELQQLIGDETADSQSLQKYEKTARTLFAVLLDTPGGIKIQTIHSFCQEVLKRFPLEAGIPPYFEILDDSESVLILSQIRQDMIANAHKGNSPISTALQYLTENSTENAFSKLMKNITDNRVKIAALLDKFGNIKAFSTALANKLQINTQETEDEIKKSFMLHINRNEALDNLYAWQKGGKNDLLKMQTLAEIMARDYSPQDYDAYISIFLTKEGAITKKLASKNAAAADEKLLQRLQDEANRVYECEKKLQHLRLYLSTIHVLTIADELNQLYDEYKRKTAKLDYTDLIIITRRLLSNPSVADWVLYKLDGGIDHILLDEAQDTSPEQWDIIKYLSNDFFAGTSFATKNRTLFVVGDRKQSIYSFQGADPDKFDTMAQYFAQKYTSAFKKVDLKVSFRSSAAVLDMVNNLFRRENVAKGVTAEDEIVNHLPFRAGEFGHVEIWPLLVAEKKEKDSQYFLPSVEMRQETSVKTLLAQKIARKIKSLVQNSQNTQNPIHYKDIMVLVQRRISFVNEFIRACKEINVNISGADRLKLTEQIAVQDLISLGKFLLLPNDDLSLAEVLKSPLFGLSDDDLIVLCAKRGKALLFSKLADFPQYADVYAQLQTLLNMTDYVRPFELYNYVLTKLNGRYKFTERMGMEVEDALDEFINLTITYEKDNIPSLQGFISWLSNQEIEIKRETEQSDNDAVRLMTVHGSKGLQAPIVFLPDTVHIKSTAKEQKFLWDNDLTYYPLNSNYYDDNCLDIKEKNNLKEIAEYRRLLYVALTRAEDQLYICGYTNKEEADAKSWYALCHQCLTDIGVSNQNIITLDTPEVVRKKQKAAKNSDINIPAPDKCLYQEIIPENPLAKPYTPSKINEPDEEEDSVSPLAEKGNYFRRGTLIHKILQFIPANDDNTAYTIEQYLDKNAADFSLEQKKQIKQEIIELLQKPEFKEIFGNNSRAEAAIIGEAEGKIISAQLDRLVILPEKIMIVDFKTNRPAAANQSTTPTAYINQLRLYEKLVRKIYPQKNIEKYILWTNEARLMQID